MPRRLQWTGFAIVKTRSNLLKTTTAKQPSMSQDVQELLFVSKPFPRTQLFFMVFDFLFRFCVPVYRMSKFPKSKFWLTIQYFAVKFQTKCYLCTSYKCFPNVIFGKKSQNFIDDICEIYWMNSLYCQIIIYFKYSLSGCWDVNRISCGAELGCA